MPRRLAQRLAFFLLLLIALSCTAWAFGAVFFDGYSIGHFLAVGYLLVMGGMLAFIKGRWRRLLALYAGFGVVLSWWLTLAPSNEGDWQPDVSQLGWAEVNGDEVTLHNVRNCLYRTETDYTPQWETRTVRLSQITGIDLAITYWGSPWMAHPILSFQFADAPPVCFSIETRKKVGQEYSAIGGLYRQFTLIYIVADERDVIRLRSNYREGEEVFLYRTNATAAQARERFLEYIHTMNSLRNHPEWYNAITDNCTTAIRRQHPSRERSSWNWRLLLNGKADELLYSRHDFRTDGLSFKDLKERALINPVAKRVNDAPDFSLRIREGRPGF